MSNYSRDPESCRVDLFQKTGKWYTTIAVDFQGFYDDLYGFENVLKKELARTDGKAGYRFEGMIAVCIEPYLKHQYPRMVTIGEWSEPYFKGRYGGDER